MKNKEQWIANVLDSANQIAENKPSPFLFQKIKHKIDLQVQLPRPANNQFTYKWAFAFIAIIALNTFALYLNSNQSARQKTINAIELNNQTVYNY
jgi:intracellular septation protein A